LPIAKHRQKCKAQAKVQSTGKRAKKRKKLTEKAKGVTPPPLWTALDRSGPLWTALDRSGPLWTALDRSGPLWTRELELL